MDHSTHGGMSMDMGSSGIFRPRNLALAHSFWYIVVGVLLFGFFLKGLRVLDSWSRRRLCRTRSISHPTRPHNFVSQAYATTLAIYRELSYPQVLYFSSRWFEWLSPPSLGRALSILTYWLVIVLFLTTGSIIHDAYYWERMGFRAAWVSITQVPLVYLLAGKVNIAGFLLGSSYVDLNWLHRWVSRTLFVTVTVHGAFFLAEWVRADFVLLELAMMPMVKYGMAAWGVLAWTMISSLLPLRRLAYELFVLQHLVSAGIFLWLLHVHVPAYASYNIWMAIGFVAFDRVIRGCWFLYRNATLRSDLLKRFGGKRIGHRTNMEAVAGDITLLTIQDVKFAWKPGQHIRLWCPSIGLFESHPFTISNVPIDKQVNTTSVPDVIQLRIRAHSGFTRRLYRLAASPQRSVSVPITTFITGPLGASPTWNTFETIVLISASTGASFTLPILESILKDPCCVCRVDFLLLIRHRSHMEGVLERLKRASSHPRSSEVFLRIQIAITGNCNEPGNGDDIKIELQSSSESETSGSGSKSLLCSGPTKTQYSSSPYAEITFEKERSPLDSQDEQEVGLSISETPQDDFSSGSGREDLLHFMKGRPNLADVIRNPVEAAAGETSIIVCGGKSLTSDVRNIVASLSDERAVHKGSGAQGIHLHVEEYGL